MTANLLTLEADAAIPGLGTGGSVRLKKGPHAGRFAIPLPVEARTSRMVFIAQIDLERGRLAGTPAHRSSPTIEVDIDTGAELRVATSNDALRRVGTLETRTDHDGSVIHRLWFRAVGHDPLVWISAMTPIRLEGTFIVTVRRDGRVTVAIDSHVTPYPAFQALARYQGRSAFVATRQIEEDATVSSLLDGGRYLRHRTISSTQPSRRMAGSVTFTGAPLRGHQTSPRRAGV